MANKLFKYSIKTGYQYKFYILSTEKDKNETGVKIL